MAEAVEAARDACTALRWHTALRRRSAEARAESVVRGARASAALDGAELPLARVRDLVGARPPEPAETEAVTATVTAALRVTAAGAELGSLLSTAPAQALARLHLAAAGRSAGPVGDDVAGGDALGRPRPAGVAPRDLVDLGPAPAGPELAARLDALGQLLRTPTEAPALVLAAVVQGELVALRPFTSGNGLVARAVFRSLVAGRGLDPTGVGVPEVGLLAGGAVSYVGSAAAYLSGTSEGLARWLTQCARGVEIGAREGSLVADAVLAGRLT